MKIHNTWSVWKTNNSLFGLQISNSTQSEEILLVKLSYSNVKVTFDSHDALELIWTD